MNKIEHVYQTFRTRHGVLDSIRFTARQLALSPLMVASSLGLSDVYIRSRS